MRHAVSPQSRTALERDIQIDDDAFTVPDLPRRERKATDRALVYRTAFAHCPSCGYFDMRCHQTSVSVQCRTILQRT